MQVVVTGATGLVGSSLVPSLVAGGHRVSRLVRAARPPARAGAIDVAWDPEAGQLDAGALEGHDAAVHLAGENIASGRWTEARKTRIRGSRVRGTRVLCEALAGLSRPPRVLVCASAIGFYGSRGDEVLREESAPGTGFLAEVCREWEAASEPAAKGGIRVVSLRIGVVLSPRGGMLGRILLPFRLGLGGKVGSGAQFLSWISIGDLVAAIEHAIAADGLRGPVNAVAPNPVTNLELTRTLGRVLRRPTPFPMPAFAARLLFGEMGDELLLGSARVVPERLLASGFAFRHPDLEGALRELLGR
ncbi:MAG: TIGR01777 family protein [Planctomycetes bacterium]|nr:TIGR01777 family protein [Planctomycetota bacterium]